jgi:hypothetical protein
MRVDEISLLQPADAAEGLLRRTDRRERRGSIISGCRDSVTGTSASQVRLSQRCTALWAAKCGRPTSPRHHGQVRIGHQAPVQFDASSKFRERRMLEQG